MSQAFHLKHLQSVLGVSLHSTGLVSGLPCQSKDSMLLPAIKQTAFDVSHVFQGLSVVSHASGERGKLHATPTRKQLGDNAEAKQRRVAYGSDVIKDELRKGTGGPQGAGPEQVGDSSEDEDEDSSSVARRESITRSVGICIQLTEHIFIT